MKHLLLHRKILATRVAQILAIGFLFILAGCVQQTPVPYFARAGDTIVLGVGGIQRNTHGATSLQPSDLQVTITNTSTHAVKTLSAGVSFKAFPDYRSQLTYVIASNASPETQLAPFDGGWFVTLNLPNDGSLPPGAYTISITSPTGKLVNTKLTSNGIPEGDLTQIPLQIVAGTGGNGDYVSQFIAYEASQNTLDVSPLPVPTSTVGGMQLVITFPAANYAATNPVVALPYGHNPFIQLSQNIIDNGNGTKTLVVLLSTSQGFVATANQTISTPLLSDLSLSLMFISSSAANAIQVLPDFTIDYTRSHYYDTSGNVIASLPHITVPQ